MRNIVFTLLILFCINEASAQLDVNPSVKWSIVRSQDMTMVDEQFYQFEFPAEKGYDYACNLFYEEKGFITNIRVLDMQFKPINARSDSASETNTALQFRVPATGTYVVLVSYKSLEEKIPSLAGRLTMIRRPEID